MGFSQSLSPWERGRLEKGNVQQELGEGLANALTQILTNALTQILTNEGMSCFTLSQGERGWMGNANRSIPLPLGEGGIGERNVQQELGEDYIHCQGNR